MARVCVLGPVELWDPSGTPAPLPPRVRRLLAALTVRAGAVADVDWLAEAVWGDDVPEHPGNAVQTLVSRLRASLRAAGGGLEVLTRSEGYVLRADAAGLDVAAFRGLVARARGQRRVEDRMSALRAALTEWRGPAYGLLADEPFVRAEAAALTEQRAIATADLAEAELAAGQSGHAQERLSALVIERPYEERPVLLLMRTLASMGRTGDALAVYADLRRRLRDDLGLDPSPEAVAAQRAVLRPRGPSAVVGLALPPDVLGRSADERALVALLLGPPRARLVTVLGPGGVGKTTVAARVARLIADDFADGSVAVELAALDAGDDVAAAVGTQLELPTGALSPTQRLIDRLRNAELLLVLDNCEHLVGEAARLVDRLLASCPGLTVLATSRRSLRLGDERVFRLDPLSEAAAVDLYRRRARQRVPGFAPSPAELERIAELCRRLDLLPLAVELAASRADVITAGELLDRWSWHRSVLRGGSAADPRHRSLTALIDWSYERLTADTQRVFDVVSVFAADFSLGDAAELLGRVGQQHDAGWSLTTLVDSSMISRSPASGRLRLLETLRTYGRSHLIDDGRWEAVAAAHAELFVDRGVAGRAQLLGPGQPTEVRRLRGSVDELRAAFGWCRSNRPDLAVRLAGSTVLLVEQTLSGEAVAWAEAVLADSGPDGPGSDDPWSCAIVAAGARFVGDLDRAATMADRARQLAAQDALCHAYAVLVRSDVALFAGDAETISTCLALATEPTRPLVQLNAVLSRHYRGERVDPATVGEIRAAAERQGRSLVAAWARYGEGELVLSSDPAAALVPLAAALEAGKAFGDEYLTGVALVSAASAAHRSGRLDQARGLFVEVVRHWQLRGDRVHQWTTLRNVVELLAVTGQPSEALALGTALLVPERHGSGYGEDAARLAVTVDRLALDLPAEVSAADVARGRELRDDQVVTLALRALSRSAQDSR